MPDKIMSYITGTIIHGHRIALQYTLVHENVAVYFQ